jgi:hypothetical protein
MVRGYENALEDFKERISVMEVAEVKRLQK